MAGEPLWESDMYDETGSQTELDKHDEVYQAAHALFRRGPDWVTFFREILGAHGVVRRAYRDPDALADFERSETYAEILRLLTRLRERASGSDVSHEPTRVITVRLPRSVHEALRVEADERHTSMNKLCISKLLQFIENELIPKAHWRTAATSACGGPEEKGAGVDL
jgi:predicted HicB family RNase H-like nuclease